MSASLALPADQTQLYEDLCAKLELQQDEDQLIHFMGGVLASLLRRKGDAAFLRTVQDAFTNGLSGRPWPQQKVLAREVIGMVIAKRPEVALAWQRVSGEEPHPLARRAVDVDAAQDDLPEICMAPEPDAGSYEAFCAAAAADISGALTRRLSLFTLPPQRFPSPTYMHEGPLFLVTEGFAKVVHDFLATVLLPLWEEPLRALHAGAGGGSAANAVAEMRGPLWTLVTNRLHELAERAASANAKLEAARTQQESGPDFQLVEVPVSRERTLSVLGVQFSLGTSTEMAVRKVPVPPAARPSGDEMQALDLVTRLHDLAADAGLELPDAADLGMLHKLLTFDAQRLADDMPGLLALVRDGDAEAEAVLDGIQAALAGHPSVVADAAVLCLFAHGVDGSFGFEELVRLASRWSEAEHPLLEAEIVRRPRDLAFQVRDALRRRLDRNNMGLTVVMLFEVWRVLSAGRHETALCSAITVFSAFPIAFAGDAAEAAFSDIGAALTKGLTAPVLDSSGTVEQVMRLYGTVVPATGARL
ncbi:MAG: hypothetical protein ACM3Q1_14525 [Bacteroidales bacterium]